MTADPAAFRFSGFRTGKTRERLAWKRVRYAADLPWPPPGASLVLDFKAPRESSLDKLTVSVHYEMYDRIPLLCKWLTVTNGGSKPVRLQKFASEILAVVESESVVQSQAHWQRANLYVESDYTFCGMATSGGNQTTRWLPDPKVVKAAVDQCAEVGFEMVILSFGSGLNMEDPAPASHARMKDLADYARAKGVEIGGYSLLASRSVSPQADVIHPKTGQPGGAIFGSSPCLGSDWGRQYLANLRAFFANTGMTVLEHDGTWEKTPSMGWMFVPLVQYHGGGAAATLEPLSEHLPEYEAHLANLFGAGVQACYRGWRLYDTDATKAVVKRWVDFYKRHRLDRRFLTDLPVDLPAGGVTWFLIE